MSTRLFSLLVKRFRRNPLLSQMINSLPREVMPLANSLPSELTERVPPKSPVVLESIVLRRRGSSPVPFPHPTTPNSSRQTSSRFMAAPGNPKRELQLLNHNHSPSLLPKTPSVEPPLRPQYYYVPPGDFLAVRGQMAESVKDALLEMVSGRFYSRVIPSVVQPRPRQ